MACCCPPTCLSCATQGCPEGSPARTATNIFLLLRITGTSLNATHTVTSVIEGICRDRDACPSTSGTTPYQTQTFSRQVASPFGCASSGVRTVIQLYGTPLNNYIWLEPDLPFYANCGITATSSNCSAFIELGTDSLTAKAAVQTNFNGNFNCNSGITVARSLSYSGSSARARVEQSFSCVTDLIGMSVSWSALGGTASNAVVFKNAAACPDVSTIDLSGGMLTLEVIGVDALP